MRRGSRYASRDREVSRAEDGDGGPPCELGGGRAGCGGGGVGGGVPAGEMGVWKPRGEAAPGLSGVW